mmetsp:Transcript_24700/g.59548  ORF Transcript_24700/g.59548 Transcript_24700/m.59548 type:complete len:422 (+) Transcript_24700:124-1389(+)
MVGRNIKMSLFLFAELVVTSAFVMAAASVTASVAAYSAAAPLHAAAGAAGGVSSKHCISNSTHCGWMGEDGNDGYHEMYDEARTNMQNYLWDNLMPYDVSRARTLGFIDANTVFETYEGSTERSSLSLVSRVAMERTDFDGLSDGILNQTLYYSLKAKVLYPWTDYIPRSIYTEYVVPYAVSNEPRSDHRPLLFDALRDTLKGYERSSDGISGRTEMEAKGRRAVETTTSPPEQIKEVVKLINTRLWSILGRTDKPIVFVAGLTPRIYDPLSVMAYGHSSCTGLAILLVSALRSVGIAARMVGTPAWMGDPDKGNHSWVEVYVPNEDGVGGKWIFLEPTPGIAEGAEVNDGRADDLDRDPCKRWFCTAGKFDGSTKVCAARFDKDAADTHYPMAWSDPENDKGVPGEDRSEYYTTVCGQCS